MPYVLYSIKNCILILFIYSGDLCSKIKIGFNGALFLEFGNTNKLIFTT